MSCPVLSGFLLFKTHFFWGSSITFLGLHHLIVIVTRQRLTSRSTSNKEMKEKKTWQTKWGQLSGRLRATGWKWRSPELRGLGDPHETEAWTQPVCVVIVRWSRQATRTALPRDHSLRCYWSLSNALWWTSAQHFSAHQAQPLPLLHCAGVYVFVRGWGQCVCGVHNKINNINTKKHTLNSSELNAIISVNITGGQQSKSTIKSEKHLICNIHMVSESQPSGNHIY